MKYDQRNILKLQISTYLEESLSMVGQMMLEDLFNRIETSTIEEAETYVEAHYDQNIFKLIAPYLQKASEEYEKYRRTPQGQEAMNELKTILEQGNKAAITYEKVKVTKTDDEGEGNVH